MGCLIFSVVLAVPRLIMLGLWLFGDYLSTAFGTWIWPFLGFFLLPPPRSGTPLRRTGTTA